MKRPWFDSFTFAIVVLVAAIIAAMAILVAASPGRATEASKVRVVAAPQVVALSDHSQPRLLAVVEEDLAFARRCQVDDAAREQLFRHHAPALHRLVSRMLGDPAEADDVVQEVFIIAFEAIGSYRGEAPLALWLRRIAIRSAWQQQNKRRQRKRVQLALIAEPSSGTTELEPTLSSRSTLRRINELLQRLGPNQRIVYLLHEIDGHSLPEVAALLDISVTAAKKRVWRARAEIERLARKDPALRTLFGEGKPHG